MSRDTGGYFDWGNFLRPSREEVQVQASCVRCDVHALCQKLGTTSRSLHRLEPQSAQPLSSVLRFSGSTADNNKGCKRF